MLTRIGFVSVWLLLCLSSCQSEKRNGQDQYTLIDDMEPRDSGAWFLSRAGFRGLWYSSTPCDQGNKVFPPAYLGGVDMWTFDSLKPSNWTFQWSDHAARLYTTGDGLIAPPTDDPNHKKWGANISVDLVTQPDPDGGAEGASSTGMDAGSENTACPPPVSNLPSPLGVDLSAYSGLVFWAKASSLVDGSGERTIHVMVHDPNSDPRGKQCYDAPEAGAEPDMKDCYNAYSKTLTLSESFERYEVDFSELQRDPTWDYAHDNIPLQLSHVYLIVFEVRNPKCVADRNARCVGDASQVLKFDFWIDDLYLVKHPDKTAFSIPTPLTPPTPDAK
jgi:hypothetical protein